MRRCRGYRTCCIMCTFSALDYFFDGIWPSRATMSAVSTTKALHQYFYNPPYPVDHKTTSEVADMFPECFGIQLSLYQVLGISRRTTCPACQSAGWYRATVIGSPTRPLSTTRGPIRPCIPSHADFHGDSDGDVFLYSSSPFSSTTQWHS